MRPNAGQRQSYVAFAIEARPFIRASFHPAGVSHREQRPEAVCHPEQRREEFAAFVVGAPERAVVAVRLSEVLEVAFSVPLPSAGQPAYVALELSAPEPAFAALQPLALVRAGAALRPSGAPAAYAAPQSLKAPERAYALGP